MNELPIVILSKQLKYSLANDKVKTLQKAVQLLPKLSQQEESKKKTIEALASKYNQIKENVINEFRRVKNNQNNIKGQSTQQMHKKIQNLPSPFYKFLLGKTICEVYGPKGCGKTSLLLHLAQKYAQCHSQNKNIIKISILNCVSGITTKRLEKLAKLKSQGYNIQCLQIPSIEDIDKIIVRIKTQINQSQFKNFFVGIDMMVLLLITRQKSKPLIIKILRNISQIAEKGNCFFVFTNLVQHKFQLGSEQIYNHASYHSQLTAEFITHKIYLQRPDKSVVGRFKLTNIKGSKMEAFFEIGLNGIKQLNAYRVQ